tara:strand:- start:2673 stop:3017 length:345 start_codon:yes stop_codon:yes gene_type:complete
MPDFDENGKFAKGNKHSFANRPQAINKKGRPKGRSIQDHLRKIIEDEVSGEQLCDALVKVAIEHALKGDFKFWHEIIERIDGKVPNRIADAEGSSLTFVLSEAVQSMDNGQTRN